LESAEPALISRDVATIGQITYVGLVGPAPGLTRAVSELGHLENEIGAFYAAAPLTDGLPDRLMVAEAARANTGSVGCHYRE
jgi:hypothetical protein